MMVRKLIFQQAIDRQPRFRSTIGTGYHIVFHGRQPVLSRLHHAVRPIMVILVVDGICHNGIGWWSAHGPAGRTCRKERCTTVPALAVLIMVCSGVMLAMFVKSPVIWSVQPESAIQEYFQWLVQALSSWDVYIPSATQFVLRSCSWGWRSWLKVCIADVSFFVCLFLSPCYSNFK